MMAFPVEANAAVMNWSDDFDDGNYDGWTVNEGTFDASGGMLTATGYAPGPDWGGIDHQSNTSMGTWSFDLHVVEETVVPPTHLWICFMRESRGFAFEGNIYAIELLSTTLYLYKGSGTSLGSYSMGYINGYHHIRIERNTTDANYFYVYHNDVLAIEAFTLVNPYDWGYFSFHSTLGSSIDNITVTEFVEDPTPTPTPTETESTTPEPSTTPTGSPEPLDTTMILIIAGGGVAVVVIIAIVVKMRS
jgi:hypothetical protein